MGSDACPCKLVLIGSGGSGKSALVQRFIQGTFVEKYDPTIWDTTLAHTQIDSKAYTIEIVDTAGQEEFASLRRELMQDGDGFIIVFSIDMMDTYEMAVSKFYPMICNSLRYAERAEAPVIFVGNKCDLVEDRQVDSGTPRDMVKEKACDYIETSAKTGENVDKAFSTIVRKIMDRETAESGSRGKSVEGKKKRKCVLW